MGIIRLTLITIVLLWLAMWYFGRDEGLPQHTIGRPPDPPAEVTLIEEEGDAEMAPATAAEAEAEIAPAPAPEPPNSPNVPEPAPIPGNAVDAAVADALANPDPTPAPAPVLVPEAAPAPIEPAPTPVPNPDPVLYVTGNRVNVRSGPATVYEVIGSLTRGAPVVDLGDAGENWRRIRLDTGQTGYMSGDFLSPTAP